jgi:hypothetical protein
VKRKEMRTVTGKGSEFEGKRKSKKESKIV